MSSLRGRVLIYIHKEQQLDDVEKRYPARHYVLAGDNLRILTAVKKHWEPRVTMVFLRQFVSGPSLTPETMVAKVVTTAEGWDFNRGNP